MTPIINPVWFYLMGLSTPISLLFLIIGFVLLILGFIYFACGHDSDNKEEISTGKKFFALAFICMLVVVITPREETLTKMLIAQNVTYERVEVATDTVENVYHDILEMFDDKESK